MSSGPSSSPKPIVRLLKKKERKAGQQEAAVTFVAFKVNTLNWDFEKSNPTAFKLFHLKKNKKANAKTPGAQ